MVGVDGLGRQELTQDTSPLARTLASDLDHLGMQVTPANVLAVRNAVAGEARRLADLLDAHDYMLTVRAPAADPVSIAAAQAFNLKISAVKQQCQAYVNALQQAEQQLKQTARAYGHTEQDIKDSFGTYLSTNTPRWDAQTRSREAIEGLPEPMRSLVQPGVTPPPSGPRLPGMLGDPR